MAHTRKRKHKTVKIEGTKVAVEIKKDHDRAPFPPPVVTHKSGTDYDRNKFRKETKKMASLHSNT